MMKFDSNRAWRQASKQVSANRDVLIALSGVFFLVPVLAFSLFLPQPQPQSGMAADQMMAVARAYYLSALPFFVPMVLLQATGTLAMLTLFTDRSRPTVGEAIKRGLFAIVPYLVAQLILGIGVGIAASIVAAIASLTGSVPAVVIALVAIIVGATYVVVKTSLSAPVIVVDHIRNPLVALRRSWQLTGHNSVRIALFYLLIVVAFVVVISVAMAIVGIALALLASPAIARVIAAVVSAALGAAMSVYFIAILAAVHRQLAGRPAEQERATFE
ncbi:MAG: hypothetical protein ABIT04_12640 [Novosphingobium sp.]